MSRYRRKTERGSYGTENLNKALSMIADGTPLRTAARQCGIPPKTLRRHRDNKVRSPGQVNLGRYTTELSCDAEGELVNLIKDMEKSLFGLTSLDIRKLAYEFAERMNILSRFNATNKIAGQEWFRLFMKRHPDLSIRQPEATSIARAIGFNMPQVNRFYDELRNLIVSCDGNAVKIWNADETGLSTVQKPTKIVATKGSRSVGKITSGEKGQTITAMCCMNAAGTYIPPMFIYPRKRFIESLLNGAPASAIGTCSPNGWTDSDCFMKWLQHFVKIVKPSKEDKHVIILDGHHSHKTLAAVLYARENGIEMLTLPPHCTHKLQPLDVAFFKSLKSAYNRAADEWLTCNKGRRITMFEVAMIFGTAYSKVATVEKAISGFASTGIYPLDSNKFDEDDFVAANMTDEPMPCVEESFNQSVSEPFEGNYMCFCYEMPF